MNHVLLTRISQLLLIFPCACREWINVLNDVEQYNRILKFALQLISFPSASKAEIIFNRASTSKLFPHLIAIGWITAHSVSALIISCGFFILVKNITAQSYIYHQKKSLCTLGLSFSIFSYIMMLGFFAMDYFLSWMQQINFNSDLIGYTLPPLAALLFLNYAESELSH